MPKVFNSVILTYPKVIKDQIDSMLSENLSVVTVMSWLKNNAKDKIKKIPSAITMKRYDIYRRTGNDVVSKDGHISKEYKNSLAINDNIKKGSFNPTVDITSKQGISEIVLCSVMQIIERLNMLIAVNSRQRDVQWEREIRGYIKDLISIMEMMLKMSGDLSQDNSIIVQLVDGRVMAFFNTVMLVVNQVMPEKAGEFQSLLKQKMKEGGY